MKDTEIPFTFTSIGTCRLADPLLFLAQAKIERIRRDQSNVYAYVHTAKEALQQLKFLTGTAIPDKYAPYINGKPQFPIHNKRYHTNLWILEISSLKEFSVNGVYLQLNHLLRKFSKTTSLFQLLLKYPDAKQLDERRRMLRNHPDFERIDETDRHVLDDSIVNMATYTSLRQDLEELRTMVSGELVVVPHLNIKNMQGNYLRNRVELSTILHGVTKELGITFFDNSELISHYGEANGMQNGGEDLNHFSNGIIPIVSHFMHHGMIDRVARGLPVLSFNDFDLSTFPTFDPNQKKVGDLATDFEEDLDSYIGEHNAERAIKLARILIDQNDIKQAHDLLETNCTDMKTASKDILILYARTIATIGPNEKRRTVAKTLLHRFGNDQRALVAAYQCYKKSHNLKEVRHVLEKIVEIDSEGGRYLKRLSTVQYSLGDIAGAVQNGARAAELGAVDAKEMVKLQDMSLRAGDYDALARLGEAATKIDGANASDVVSMLLASGRIDLAGRVLAVIPVERRDRSAYRSVIKGLQAHFSKSNEDVDSVRALASAVILVRLDERIGGRLIGVSSSIIREQARLLIETSDNEKAMALLRDAVAIAPGNEVLLKELAVISKKNENWPQALAAWKELDKNFPANNYLPKAIHAARKLGDWVSAIQLQTKLSGETPADPAHKESLDWFCRKAFTNAKNLADLGTFIEAAKLIAVIQQSTSFKAKTTSLVKSIRQKLVPVLTGADAVKADQAATTILLICPNDPASLKVRALSLEKSGNKAKAAGYWQQLAEGRSGKYTHWRRAAKLFAAIGELEQAEHAKAEAARLEAEVPRELSS